MEDLDLKILEKVQENLAKRTKLFNGFKKLEFVSGVDLGYKKPVACLVTLDREMKPVELVRIRHEVRFPYIPGFLAFREGPAILACLKKTRIKPDLVFVDGHGIAHPRGLGLASLVGLLANIPTIGIAKRRLVGEFEEPEDGEARPLMLGKRQVGWVYKPRGRKPVFISPGHLVSLGSSLEITRRFILNSRLPEPLRLADQCTKS